MTLLVFFIDAKMLLNVQLFIYKSFILELTLPLRLFLVNSDYLCTNISICVASVHFYNIKEAAINGGGEPLSEKWRPPIFLIKMLCDSTGLLMKRKKCFACSLFCQQFRKSLIHIVYEKRKEISLMQS